MDREDVKPVGTGEAGAPEPGGAPETGVGKTSHQKVNESADREARKGLDEQREDDNQIFSK